MNQLERSHRCRVVVCRADALLTLDEKVDLRLLSPAEVGRAKAFRSESAYREFVAAHVLVRRIAADVGNLALGQVSVVQRCAVCGGPHGRPVVLGHATLHISMSHGAGWVAGIAGAVRNAVDIERWAPFLDPAMLNEKVYCAEELGFLAQMGSDDTPCQPEARAIAAAQMWARKECMIKLGMLSLDEMASFNTLRAGDEGSPTALPLFFDWISRDSGLVGAAAVMGAVEAEFDCATSEFRFAAGAA